MPEFAKTCRLTLGSLLLFAGLALFPVWVFAANGMDVVVRGVEEPMRSNVESAVRPFRLTGAARYTPRRLDRMRRDV